MVQIPLVDLKAQYAAIKPEIDAAIARVLDSTGFILGAEVLAFEKKYAAWVGVRGAVGVASGTAALHLALRACGVGPGDEVITTAYTFVATAEAISQVGATPVFVDIEPATFNLDPALVERAITPCTKAIVPVHLYGQPARMDALVEIARRHRLRLIEDAAQAHGSAYRGTRVGGFGDLACFSFFPGKNLGAYGDGGAVTGNDEELLARVRRLRDHGRTTKYEHVELGFGERLDALQAAVVAVKLDYIDAWNDARRAHAVRYHEVLEGCPIARPEASPDVRHVYHLYVIRAEGRDALLDRLKARGVSAGVHYPIPVHRQPVYMRQGYDRLSLPLTERAAQEVLSLPMYPELSDEQIGHVAAAVREAVRL